MGSAGRAPAEPRSGSWRKLRALVGAGLEGNAVCGDLRGPARPSPARPNLGSVRLGAGGPGPGSALPDSPVFSARRAGARPPPFVPAPRRAPASHLIADVTSAPSPPPPEERARPSARPAPAPAPCAGGREGRAAVAAVPSSPEPRRRQAGAERCLPAGPAHSRCPAQPARRRPLRSGRPCGSCARLPSPLLLQTAPPPALPNPWMAGGGCRQLGDLQRRAAARVAVPGGRGDGGGGQEGWPQVLTGIPETQERCRSIAEGIARDYQCYVVPTFLSSPVPSDSPRAGERPLLPSWSDTATVTFK